MTAEQYAVRDCRYASYTPHKLKRDAKDEWMRRLERIRANPGSIKLLAEYGLKPEEAYQVAKGKKTWRVEATWKHHVATRLQIGAPVRVETVKTLGLIGVDNHQVINNCYVKPT